jgi:hypothetical protein
MHEYTILPLIHRFCFFVSGSPRPPPPEDGAFFLPAFTGVILDCCLPLSAFPPGEDFTSFPEVFCVFLASAAAFALASAAFS